MNPVASSMIADRLQRIHDTISGIASDNGRDPSDIRLIAVSKTRSVDEVRQALDAGQVDLGENTVQDALNKIPVIPRENVCWHFIGRLQSNKTNKLAGHFDWIHSVDSLKLLQRLQHSLQAIDAPPLQCLLQVNLSGEVTKSGLDAAGLVALVSEVQQADLDRIRLRGLMTIGVADDAEASRRVFAACRELAADVRRSSGLSDFDQLSMGMSGDYPLAIAEGATMIRLGTAIFGERDYSAL